MSFVSRLCAIAILTVSICGPARADNVSSIKEKLGAASAGVTSFVVQMQVTGTSGVGGTMTVVKPGRVKTQFNLGQMSTQSYLVDGVVYLRMPAGSWQKMPVDSVHAPRQTANIAEALKSAKVKLLADRTEDGDAVGVIQVDMAPLPQPVGSSAPDASMSSAPMLEAAQHLVCSYDKTTYRMRICASSFMTLTYTKYNDPDNVVELPPDALKALPLALPAVAGTPATAAPAPDPPASSSTAGPAPATSAPPVADPTAAPATPPVNAPSAEPSAPPRAR